MYSAVNCILERCGDTKGGQIINVTKTQPSRKGHRVVQERVKVTKPSMRKGTLSARVHPQDDTVVKHTDEESTHTDREGHHHAYPEIVRKADQDYSSSQQKSGEQYDNSRPRSPDVIHFVSIQRKPRHDFGPVHYTKAL